MPCRSASGKNDSIHTLIVCALFKEFAENFKTLLKKYFLWYKIEAEEKL